MADVASAAVPGSAPGALVPDRNGTPAATSQERGSTNVIPVAGGYNRGWRNSRRFYRGGGRAYRGRAFRAGRAYGPRRAYRAAPRFRNRAAWRNRHNVWRRYPRPPRRWGPPRGGRPWRHWRGHRYYYYRGDWWPYAWLGGVVVLPSVVYRDAPPRYYYDAPRPWTPEWYAYCASKYRTFNPRSGYYFYKPGKQRFCR
ncbi:MAG: hypothetical protein C0606_10865 [Hyphomicrobiales bacterium]|nr:MAG: hypothetical protein C0606_10865 [Hyphomicrobiales bacterium]